MKNWQETQQIITRLTHLLDAGVPAALATIVRIQGSTYRRPGAKLLIETDGRMMGNVSGGCLEEDVRETALAVMASGEPRSVHYDTSDAEDKVWGMGLGCNGQVDVFIQPITADVHRAVLSDADARLEGDNAFVLRIGLTGAEAGRISIEASAEPLPDTHCEASVFVERLLPPPTLLVCGAGDDALPLVRMANEIGFRVVVADHRSAYLTSDRFPDARRCVRIRPDDDVEEGLLTDRTLAVVKTHAQRYDGAWVERLVASPVPYIGLLGPKERREDIMKQIDPEAHPRIYGPVGLDIGGEGPEQVAVSILAETLSVWNNRSAGYLRDRNKAIHTN